MTKLELTQRLNVATKENVALSDRVAQLHAQLIAERAERKSPHTAFAERMAAAKAEAIRTGKCVLV